MAQTYYYKLISYGKSGTENKKVSGGQFITFQAAICMETDKDGCSVGNGYLQRKANDRNQYVGTSYWGGGSRFIFSSNKSSLKIITPKGITYIYTQSATPNGVRTCSLIKGSTPQSSGYVPSSPTSVQKTQSCGICYGTGKCSTCNGSGVSQYGHAHIYGACGGTGKCATCNGTGISGYVTEYSY